jgi:sterol desaturase/sphingolipid hydroxylase (fatty acid hydroxylase superfamily)
MITTERKINNNGQARLFNHPLLEQLTKAHPLLIWGMYTGINIVMIRLAQDVGKLRTPQILYWILLGFLTWTLTEYLIHRFVFHHEPTTVMGKRIHYLFHGNHHEYPRDRDRLFMPPIPSLMFSAIFFASFYFFLGTRAYAFFPGFMLGYLIYGTIHYCIHAYSPPFKWMKPLWRNHHLHHYKDGNKGFGVSSTFWDRVFGTMF